MELNRGLQRSKNQNKVDHGGWWDARNIVVSDEYKDITNEEGFSLVNNVAGSRMGVIATNDSYVVFLADGSIGEIGIFDSQDNYTRILRTSELGFKPENPIEGVFTYNARNELIIIWWDGLEDDANPPYILNTTCLPFEVNGSQEPIDPTKVSLLKLFPDIGCSDFTLNKVNNTGGVLETGVLAFTYAYVLSDGSTTNHSGLSNWVSIVKDLDSAKFINYDGSESGLTTSKSVSLTLSNINTNYSQIQIGVVKRIGGVTSSVVLDTIAISGATLDINYSGLATEYDIDIGLLLTPTSSFTRVKTGTILDSRLTLCNAKTQPALDYQAYANNIKVSWVRTGDDINLATSTNSYKDPVILFDKRSYATDEVYSWYCWFKNLDGTFSRAFHVPNIEAAVLPGYGAFVENDLVSAINAVHPENRFAEALLVDSDVRFHEMFNSAGSGGKMGYWENQDELYADEDCSDIKDNVGAVIGTLRNKKVRHHKFPSIKLLEDWANPFYSPSAGTAVTRNWDATAFPCNTAGSNNFMDFTYAAGTGGFIVIQIVDGLVIEATAAISGYFKMSISLSAITVDLRFTAGAGIDYFTAEEFNTPSIFAPKSKTFILAGYVNLNVGDRVGCSIEITSAIITSQPVVDSSDIYFDLDNTSESDGTTKAIGVQFSDIHIPTEIKEKVDCIYFGYATRSIINQTKLGQSRFVQNELVQEANAFDIKMIEPPASPSYIKTQIRYTAPTDNLLFNATAIAEEVVRSVEEHIYIPPGIVTDFNGTRFDLTDEHSSSLALKLASTLTNTLYFGSVYQYKTNLYNSFDNQKLVTIAIAQDKNSATSDVLYGGDTVINPVGFFQKGTTDATLDVQETAAVVGYRYEIEIENKFYSPLSIRLSTDKIDGDSYNYNLDYTSLNNLLPLIIANCAGTCDPLSPNNDAPFTVARSVVQPSESNNLGYRKFLANEYFVMRDKTKGEIWKVLAYNKTLLIYQKYSLFAAAYRDVMYTEGIETYLGSGDIFDRPPSEVIPDTYGYAGNQSQWCTFLTKHGAVHVDTQQGKVFLYSGEIKELSNKNMRQWFYDQRDTIVRDDNPFMNSGWTGSFDEKYNRILLTKNDPGLSKTLSYSFDFGTWVCWHDYFPSHYFYNRIGIYNIRNIGVATTTIYKMNDGAPGMYHQVAPVPPFESYIEPILSEPFDVSKTWQAVYWNSLSEDSNRNTDYDDTITHILVYNNNQCSGVIELLNGKNLINDLDNNRNVEYTWKFNNFRDLVIDPKAEIVNVHEGVVNLANINLNTVWFEKSKFISKFIAVRFIYDNVSKRRFHLQSIDVLARKSYR